MFHFLIPAHPLEPRQPDEPFGEQFEAFSERGFSVSLIAESVIQDRSGLRGISPRSLVVYRGWMLSPDEYDNLVTAVEAADAVAFIPKQEYLATHYLPNWYPLIPEFTPETRVYPVDADMSRELWELGWGSYFVKDYVKSLKTSVGSIVTEPSQIARVLEDMEKYRGSVEGGICIRQVEDFVPDTEKRFFVIEGQPYAPDRSAAIPEVVSVCARRIPSKFFSVDVVRRRDGVLRVVEIGDGQVSDLVGWSAVSLAAAWVECVGDHPR